MCRSRRELSNEYLVAKFGFDTAENDSCEVRKLKLSEMLNLNFEISKLIFATQLTIRISFCCSLIAACMATIPGRARDPELQRKLGGPILSGFDAISAEQRTLLRMIDVVFAVRVVI